MLKIFYEQTLAIYIIFYERSPRHLGMFYEGNIMRTSINYSCLEAELDIDSNVINLIRPVNRAERLPQFSESPFFDLANSFAGDSHKSIGLFKSMPHTITGNKPFSIIFTPLFYY